MRRIAATLLASLAAALVVASCATTGASPPSNPELAREVEATERAFAKTMADRDLAQFQGFLADEVIFFSGAAPLRGKDAVGHAWARFFQSARAPFSWAPDHVAVLDSGTLALTTGPVWDEHGKVIARFHSIWRREAPGTWRIVFDGGSPACDAR